MPPTTLNSEEPHNPTRRTQNDYTTPQDLTELSNEGTVDSSIPTRSPTR